MERFEELEKRINKALNNMEAKISFLHDSTGQLKVSFGELQEETGEFMKYIAEHVTNHAQRISKIKKASKDIAKAGNPEAVIYQHPNS